MSSSFLSIPFLSVPLPVLFLFFLSLSISPLPLPPFLVHFIIDRYLSIWDIYIELISHHSKKSSSWTKKDSKEMLRKKIQIKNSDWSGIIPIIEVMTVRSLIWIPLTSTLPTTSYTKITGQIGSNLTCPSIQPAHDPKAIQHGAGREMKGPTGGPSPAWSKSILWSNSSSKCHDVRSVSLNEGFGKTGKGG